MATKANNTEGQRGNSGNVFAIKKYAIHDGPNIRTTVFLKGCPLKCRWCHNPEGMASEIAMLWDSKKCIGCGECVSSCPNGSLTEEGGVLTRDKVLCRVCRSCAEACPALAQESTGWTMTVADVVAEIKKDLLFYDESGGGVTFSGGEPLMQLHFLMGLLQECGKLGIHRAVDSCLFATTQTVIEISKYCELFLVDLKHMDSEKHNRFTGVPNEQILENIKILCERGCALRIRIPLIEGFNSDDENMGQSGEFIASLPQKLDVDLLPYHSIAAAKYRKLGLKDPGYQFTPISKVRVEECAKILAGKGLKVRIGG